MRTELSRSTRGIQGFSSRGSARDALSIPFAYRATIGQSAFFRAKESSGSGSGTTATTTAFSRATKDLPNDLALTCGRAPKATDRQSATACWTAAAWGGSSYQSWTGMVMVTFWVPSVALIT